MSGLVIGAIICLLLLILMAIGVPVSFALGLTAMISILVFLTMGEFGYFANFVFASLNNFTLLAIPLFILMGAIFGQSQASRDLLEAAHVWIGRLRGGLAMSSVVACSLFAALTGSSPATSAAIGKIAIPEMKKRGYPNTVSTGAIVAGGTLGILIPPSVTLILYGVATEQSIGRLFLGGVAPGIMLTVLFCLWIFIAISVHRMRGHSGRQEEGGATRGSGQALHAVAGAEAYGWKDRFAMLIKVIPFILLIVGILAALYAGVATPSEAAAVGALFSLVLVGILYRSVTPRSLMSVALETTRTSTMILLIVAFSAVLGQVMSFLGVPQDLAQWVAGLEVNTLADGFFHLGTWLFVAAGMVLTVRAWQQGRLAPPWRAHIGMLLAGWGAFNLVEGLIDHQLLGIHHVRDDLGGPVSWDVGFLLFGAALFALGLVLRNADVRRSESAAESVLGKQRS